MSLIGPITQDVINACANELKKKEVKEKIMKNLIDPIVSELLRRYSSHIAFYLLVHLFTIILLVYLIYLNKK